MQAHFYLADQNPHRDRTLGVTAYTEGILRGVHQARPGWHLAALGSRSSWRPPPELNFAWRAVPWRTDTTAGRLLADQFHPAFWGGAGRGGVTHYPKGHLSPLGRPRGLVSGTMHDTILQHYADHYPGTRPAAEFAYWLTVLRRSLSRFDLVLTISEFSRRRLEEFAHRHRLRLPPLRVTWVGARWENELGVSPVGKKGDYVIHLASRLPHKRTQTLLEHWAVLQERGMDLPVLRLFGKMDEACLRLAGRLRGVEASLWAEESGFKQLLREARALILPSEIEGFGLPLVEAYYLGTPVAFVVETVAEELLWTGAPGGFRLDSPDSLATALQELEALTPEAIGRTALRLRERFAWSRVSTLTLDAWREFGMG